MELGTVVYALCRILKPEVIVETGVAGGISSVYILAALEQNECGRLYSIDLTWGITSTYARDSTPRNEGDNHSGWLIPDYLKDKWQLLLGSSSERLQPLFEDLDKIDIFLHNNL